MSDTKQETAMTSAVMVLDSTLDQKPVPEGFTITYIASDDFPAQTEEVSNEKKIKTLKKRKVKKTKQKYIRPRKHDCEKCLHSANSPSALGRHMLIHSDERWALENILRLL
jgi:hypothetical protein